MPDETSETSACEVCGEMVTTYGPARARHMNKHKFESLVESIDKPPVAEPKGANVGSGDPSTDELIQRALDAQEKFKKAPDVFVAEQTSDVMMELRKRYAPKSLGENPTDHVFFGLYHDLDSLVSKGYRPLLDEKRKLIRYNELVMTSRPIAMHERHERAFQLESRRRVRKALEGQDVRMNTGRSDGNIPSPSTDGMKVEELEVEHRERG